jgi:hypothetical protein
MKTASSALKTFLLNTPNYARVDLYTITLVGGTILRFCSAPGVVKNGGFTYGGLTPIVADGGVECKRGIEDSPATITFYADDSHEVNGEQFISFIENGGLGTFVRFAGRYSEASDIGHSSATIKYSSYVGILSTAFPPEVYQTECINCLGDTNCGVNLASHAASGIVGSGTWTKTEFGSNLATTAGIYDLGYVVFTSGTNEGAQISVKTQDASGEFTLVAPLGSIPVSGDTFTAYPGCAKSMTSCSAKFNNLLRFRGCPFIPTPTTGLVT